jgi:hypothetical protein
MQLMYGNLYRSVEALQLNTFSRLSIRYVSGPMMKSSIRPRSSRRTMNESLPLFDDSCMKDFAPILRLNGAGRRYLKKDGQGSVVSRGVDVLSAVMISTVSFTFAGESVAL